MEKAGRYVRFRAQSDQRDKLVHVLLEAARLMADAPGCELYTINTEPDDPDVVWVTEIWRCAADIETALALPGTRELVSRAMSLLDGPPERTDLRPLGGVGLRD